MSLQASQLAGGRAYSQTHWDYRSFAQQMLTCDFRQEQYARTVCMAGWVCRACMLSKRLCNMITRATPSFVDEDPYRRLQLSTDRPVLWLRWLPFSRRLSGAVLMRILEAVAMHCVGFQEDRPNFLELHTGDSDASTSDSGGEGEVEAAADQHPQIVMDLACGVFDLQVPRPSYSSLPA